MKSMLHLLLSVIKFNCVLYDTNYMYKIAQLYKNSLVGLNSFVTTFVQSNQQDKARSVTSQVARNDPYLSLKKMIWK